MQLSSQTSLITGVFFKQHFTIFVIFTISVCPPFNSTTTVSFPLSPSTMICKGSSVSICKTVQKSVSSSAFALSSCSLVSSSSTSKPSSLLPPTKPTTHAASTPRNPFVLGTKTLLTFFKMLPLTLIHTLSILAPITSATLAEANAIAMGSVQPRQVSTLDLALLQSSHKVPYLCSLYLFI